MLREISILIALLNVFTFISFSQNQRADEYQPPEVIEGSNLTLDANPNLYLSNEDIPESASTFTYYLSIMADYRRWRYTDRLDYAFSTSLFSSLSKYPYSSNDAFRSYSRFGFGGGASYYLLKHKLFAGGYSYVSTQFYKGKHPVYFLNIYPNIGYGKITDAFVVNETSNFEKVLSDENYLNKRLDKKTRAILNSMLDKRNGSVFSSLYKNDAEIEFFTELEKFLLDEKIIDKPLTARVTMKLFQTLYDRNFILFPLYKGYQFQTELDYQNSNYEDTIIYPCTLSLNAAYGLLLSNKTSILFSAHYVFPLNKNYNIDFFSANMHSPVFIRSEYMNISNYHLINRSYIPIYRYLYDYKAAAAFYVFHYLNRSAGLSGRIEYAAGKQKSPLSDMEYSLNVNADLVFNIINKLRLTTGIDYRYSNKDYYFSFGSGISYYIF